ncbi:ExbD/TolR family protein [Terasakiella sp.]|uniref:ExbD/TolR family protein n=1 Tax=Terasakiella sp. TaxID=2034861 RepID=UPI003AA7E317
MKSLKQTFKKQKRGGEEHILPLINVVFLLLIFFMIAGKLTTSDPFKIDPAKSMSETHVEQKTALIHLGEGKKIAFQNEEMDQTTLLRKLTGYMQDHPDSKVRLKVDGAYPAGEVLQFLSTLRESGVEKVALLTRLQKGEAQ